MALWIGRLTPNVVSAVSIPRSRLKIYKWVTHVWLVLILHVSQCIIDLKHNIIIFYLYGCFPTVNVLASNIYTYKCNILLQQSYGDNWHRTCVSGLIEETKPTLKH